MQTDQEKEPKIGAYTFWHFNVLVFFVTQFFPLKCIIWLQLSLQQFIMWVCKCATSLQFCPTLWDRMDCSLPGSSVHGILQARTLRWVAISISICGYTLTYQSLLMNHYIVTNFSITCCNTLMTTIFID